MSDLTTHKWVRVMCDFASEGVWSKDGAACSIEELPVSVGLRKLILEWQAEYEQENGHVVERFSADGLAIAKAVKAELPDWTVIYFDDAKADATPSPMDRAKFEYEIQG